MSNHSDELSKAPTNGVPRGRTPRLIGGRLAFSVLAAIGITVLAVIGIREVSAAPAPCAVFCSGLRGPAKASCTQACRQCGGDATRICPTPTAFVCCASGESCCPGVGCCSSGESCCFDCTVGHLNCGALCSIGYFAGSCDDTCGACGP